jgi:hypothetical protein
MSSTKPHGSMPLADKKNFIADVEHSITIDGAERAVPYIATNVRFGSLADVVPLNSYVRFTPNSGHRNWHEDARPFSKLLRF